MALNGEVRPLELQSTGGLRILVHKQGTTTTLEMAGEWDLAGQDAARDAITHALAAQPERVLLDLSRLEFIDSSGLHITTELTHRCAAQNIRLVIIPGPRAVQHVFELTGLLERLPFIHEQPNGSRAASSRKARHSAAGSTAGSLPTGRL